MGRIRVVSIGRGLEFSTVCLADDTAIFLQVHQQSVQRLFHLLGKLEVAAGARINLQKSRLLMIGKKVKAPSWLQEFGIPLVGPFNWIGYLGAAISRVDGPNKLALAAWEEVVLPNWWGGLGVSAFIIFRLPSAAEEVVGEIQHHCAQMDIFSLADLVDALRERGVDFFFQFEGRHGAILAVLSEMELTEGPLRFTPEDWKSDRGKSWNLNWRGSQVYALFVSGKVDRQVLKLNMKWGLQWSLSEWENVWTIFTLRLVSPRHRAFMWRTVHKAFLDGVREQNLLALLPVVFFVGSHQKIWRMFSSNVGDGKASGVLYSLNYQGGMGWKSWWLGGSLFRKFSAGHYRVPRSLKSLEFGFWV
ncbi:hypothetical protein R1sor_003089 [Riccia sorocarpa]|uniref:Reverse transcriptase zinc-binding domain-containing protein n=1 Tax=Riccia sorocarpa TaxID=122646 RepID=A0ABD3H0L2_9MARC